MLENQTIQIADKNIRKLTENNS